MKPSHILVFVLAALVPAAPAFADDAAPTAEQLDAAKKAFADGKSLHDAGKLPEAIDKFKESYRLSKNPLLLYNVGFTMDEAGQKDSALLYYRKFLTDAPQNAPQRQQVADRVKVLEKEKLEADLNGKPEPKAAEPKAAEPKQEHAVKIKPAGTYSATDFQHQVVEEAPPGKPLDITAFVPEDSGFTVTLYFRGAGDATFTQKAMKWRYKELIGRIPAAKMAGSSIQYYLEVKDQAGNVVTRSGKTVSPNLVNIEAGATAKFYPDLTDEGEKVSPAVTRSQDDSDDPLNAGKHHKETKTASSTDGEPQRDVPIGPQTGFTDVGSKKFTYAKWGSTGAAAAFLGLSMVFYIEAGKQATALLDDTKSCPMGQTPPCRPFDKYDHDLQEAGKRDQTISNTTLVFGVVTAGIAGYFWYRELTAKKHGELKVTSKNQNPETTWVVVPSLVPDGSNNFYGAAAAARF